jgi:hypothetical protein
VLRISKLRLGVSLYLLREVYLILRLAVSTPFAPHAGLRGIQNARNPVPDPNLQAVTKCIAGGALGYIYQKKKRRKEVESAIEKCTWDLLDSMNLLTVFFVLKLYLMAVL